MDRAAVEWLNDNQARIVMDVRASSPEQARRIAASRIMRPARAAHIDVDEVEILSVLEVA
jgi:hypothetical protein